MQDILRQILETIREPGLGVVVVSFAAIAVAGMSVYGMIIAIKKKG
ncbi:MAG: hypothetical protein P4L43_05785 [Syntrophobacteraceae bacterium]|nr:hypothetical protein [Syntrophobacteraceae bacterium]